MKLHHFIYTMTNTTLFCENQQSTETVNVKQEYAKYKVYHWWAKLTIQTVQSVYTGGRRACRTNQHDCVHRCPGRTMKTNRTMEGHNTVNPVTRKIRRSLNDAVQVAVRCGRHAKTLDDRSTQIRHCAVLAARRRIIEILTDAGRTSTFQRCRRAVSRSSTAQCNITVQLALSHHRWWSRVFDHLHNKYFLKFNISYLISVARWHSGQGAGHATDRSLVWVLDASLHVRTTLDKLFTHMPLFTKQYKLVPVQAGS